jgi:hypothetical protein
MYLADLIKHFELFEQRELELPLRCSRLKDNQAEVELSKIRQTLHEENQAMRF